MLAVVFTDIYFYMEPKVHRLLLFLSDLAFQYKLK